MASRTYPSQPSRSSADDAENALLTGRLDDALRSYTVALAAAREAGDRALEARSLRGLGDTAKMQERFVHAERSYHAAAECYRAAGEELGWAHAQRSLADLHRLLGRPAQAQAEYGLALEIYRRRQIVLGEAKTLHGLGEAASTLGEHDRAASTLTAALALFRRIGDRRGQANVLLSMSSLDAAESARNAAQAAALFDEIGDRRGAANAHLWSAEHEIRCGRLAAGIGHVKAALAIYAELGSRWGTADALATLGDALVLGGAYPEAERLYDRARVLHRDVGNAVGERNCADRLTVVRRLMQTASDKQQEARTDIDRFTESVPD
jgi:tetratricopeptide (TPR) repeat protein